MPHLHVQVLLALLLLLLYLVISAATVTITAHMSGWDFLWVSLLTLLSCITHKNQDWWSWQVLELTRMTFKFCFFNTKNIIAFGYV